MNKIPCVIENILYDENLIYLSLSFKEYFLSVMLLKDNKVLDLKSKVNVIFKETQVGICDKSYTQIGVKNKFISKVIDFEESLYLVRVIFDFEGIEISALILKDEFEKLSIQKDKDFMWFVKSWELMLEYI